MPCMEHRTQVHVCLDDVSNVHRPADRPADTHNLCLPAHAYVMGLSVCTCVCVFACAVDTAHL